MRRDFANYSSPALSSDSPVLVTLGNVGSIHFSHGQTLQPILTHPTPGLIQYAAAQIHTEEDERVLGVLRSGTGRRVTAELFRYEEPSSIEPTISIVDVPFGRGIDCFPSRGAGKNARILVNDRLFTSSVGRELLRFPDSPRTVFQSMVVGSRTAWVAGKDSICCYDCRRPEVRKGLFSVISPTGTSDDPPHFVEMSSLSRSSSLWVLASSRGRLGPTQSRLLLYDTRSTESYPSYSIHIPHASSYCLYHAPDLHYFLVGSQRGISVFDPRFTSSAVFESNQCPGTGRVDLVTDLARVEDATSSFVSVGCVLSGHESTVVAGWDVGWLGLDPDEFDRKLERSAVEVKYVGFGMESERMVPSRLSQIREPLVALRWMGLVDLDESDDEDDEESTRTKKKIPSLFWLGVMFVLGMIAMFVISMIL